MPMDKPIYATRLKVKLRKNSTRSEFAGVYLSLSNGAESPAYNFSSTSYDTVQVMYLDKTTR